MKTIKFTFFLCFFSFSTLYSLSQTKKESQDWVIYYLNKYFSDDFSYEQKSGWNKTLKAPYTWHSYEYSFMDSNFIVTTHTYEIDTSNKQTTIGTRDDIINLKRVIKMEKQESKDLDNPYWNYVGITFVFKELEYNIKGEFNYPVISYDIDNRKDITPQKDFAYRYEIISRNKEAVDSKIETRLLNAFEYLIKLNGGKVIKDIF